RRHRTTHERAPIAPAPKQGQPPYRSYWNAPIITSAHDPKTLYFGGQYVFKSTDRGDSWTTISADLTTGVDRNTLPIMGVAEGSADCTRLRRDFISVHHPHRRIAFRSERAVGRNR